MDIDLSEALSCQRCPLSQTRKNVVWGEMWTAPWRKHTPGECLLMAVAEAPGHIEDLTARPLVGSAGKIFRRLLLQAGVEVCYLTNRVKCNPPGLGGRGNRRPSSEEIDSCAPWFQAELDIWQPSVILLMGITAIQPVFQSKTVGEVIGKSICRGGRIWVATYHPSYILHQRGSEIGKRAEQQILADIKYAWWLVQRKES